MKAKANRSLSEGIGDLPNLSKSQTDKAIRSVAAWKWEDPFEFARDQLKIVDLDDPDFPPGALIECGNLARIHFRSPRLSGDRHPRRQRDTTITLTQAAAKKSFLCFDPEHPDQRLYIWVAEAARPALAQRFWNENQTEARLLGQWAILAGGRHARHAMRGVSEGGYPRVMAKPVGIMTAVVYFTTKKDDGPSFYIHNLGEISCTYPILVCDQRGRLWVCGSNATAPTPGITD